LTPDLATDPKPIVELLGRVVGPGAGPPTNVQRLSAGASSQVWSFDCGAPKRGYILRVAAPGAQTVSITTEVGAMEAAGGRGVPVPPVLFVGDDPAPFGQPYMLMERVEGETLARHILRDEQFAPAREQFAAQCGRVLGRLHQLGTGDVPGLLCDDQLERWSDAFMALHVPVATFEWALRYLRTERPPARQPAVVHGDFRLGNLIIGPEGLRAVLDWDLVHLGNPLEDLGWLCARPWRFRAPAPVGGMGRYEELIEAYEKECGTAVEPEELRWWEVFATLRWGIICLLQAQRHLNGSQRSVELAAIGRRLAETELDLLDCVP
jgi:aminoglycoside phosphotransferase (APT) family kinase protein